MSANDADGDDDCERSAEPRKLNHAKPQAGLWERLQTTDRGCAGDRAADAAEQTGQQAAETAAAAIAAFKADFTLSVEQQLANGIVLANQAIDSGRAKHLLEEWAKLSQEIAIKYPA